MYELVVASAVSLAPPAPPLAHSLAPSAPRLSARSGAFRPAPCAHLVIVVQLLADLDAAQRVDGDLLLAAHLDDARHAVGVAAVVDEAGGVALGRNVFRAVFGVRMP